MDLDGSEVANRYRGRTMQNQVWPNIIIYFPIEYYVNIAYTSHGVTKHYESDWLNARIKDLQVTYDTADRDEIARDIGNYMYDNHVSMPLFWFPHTITVNPEVVGDWIYPGNTVPRLCCARLRQGRPLVTDEAPIPPCQANGRRGLNRGALSFAN